jgi:hypothetical protein
MSNSSTVATTPTSGGISVPLWAWAVAAIALLAVSTDPVLAVKPWRS